VAKEELEQPGGPEKRLPTGGRSAGLRPTRVGFAFFGLALLIALAALNTGNNGLFLVTAVMAASLFGSHLLGAANLRKLRFAAGQATIGDHGEVFAGRPFEIGLRLQRRGPLPGRLLAVRLDLPGLGGTRLRSPAALLAGLAAGEERELRLEAVARRRGRFRLREVQVSSLFPLGLFDHRRGFPLELEWLVFPEIFPRGEGRPPQRSGYGAEPVARPGQGLELLGLRPYHPGDDPRSIHWKQTARQGLLISQQRQHEERRRVTIVLDNATGELDEDGQRRFERLVSEAATAALDFLDEGCEVALLTRDQRLPFGTGLRHRLQLLEILALIGSLPSQKTPLESDESRIGTGSRLHLGLSGREDSASGAAGEAAGGAAA
jgi:uncharacterized protein (DUF58 family)